MFCFVIMYSDVCYYNKSCTSAVFSLICFKSLVVLLYVPFSYPFTTHLYTLLTVHLVFSYKVVAIFVINMISHIGHIMSFEHLVFLPHVLKELPTLVSLSLVSPGSLLLALGYTLGMTHD